MRFANTGPETGGFEEALHRARPFLMPVAHPGLSRRPDGRLSVVAYPADVFFGGLVARAPGWICPEGVLLSIAAPRRHCTLAAYRYAVEGAGRGLAARGALVAEDIPRVGRLHRVADAGPDLALEIRMIRLAGGGRERARRGWDVILDAGGPVSERLP